jgi:3-hydroxybutyryl-CoA dehydrogenase
MSETGAAPAPRTVAVAGAGTMGAGIGLCFAIAGSTARLSSRRAATLEQARRQVDASLALLVEHGRLDGAAAAAARARVHYTREIAQAVAGADLVIESIVEDLDVKRALLRTIDAAAPPDAIIATNTSSLELEPLAACVSNPGRFAGFHWFNPPELIELVEVVAAPATAPATVDRLLAWSLATGKRPIQLRRPIAGFVANRLQYAVLREAYALLEAGVCDEAAIDTAVTAGIGARWAAVGPFTSMDLAGLDVHLEVARQLFPQLANTTAPPPRLEHAVAAGHLGAKSGHGLRGAYDPTRTAEIADHRAAILLELARRNRQG